MTEKHDETWHRNKLADAILSVRSSPGWDSGSELAAAIVIAIRDITSVGAQASHAHEMVKIRGNIAEVLGVPSEGSALAMSENLVAAVRSGATLERRTGGTSEPFARRYRALREAMGHTPEGAGTVSWEDMLADICAAREMIRGGITGELPPGLTVGIAKISDACGAVRAALREALGAGDGEYTATTLVQFAILVRDRLADTRSRSEAWLANFLRARDIVVDTMAAASASRASAAEIEGLLNERIEHAKRGLRAIDDFAKGVAPA